MSENFSPFKSDAQTNNAIIGNRYELLELIGQGAMSKVYKGRDTSLGRIVAIKFLREEYGGNSNFVARFSREARAVASLPDEHLVSIYDFGQYNTTYFIVMEYVEGRNLKELIRQEAPYSPQKVIEMVTPVLLALKAAHSQGIIHRDIKPQNIMVRREDGAVKLTDFGVAYAQDNAQVTSTGMVIGTADYMAPEQARGEPVGPPADLYAVGIVLFELLTAHLPYTGENTIQIIMAHINQPIPSLGSYGITVPPALERLVQRAMAKDAHNRFQSAQEMLNAFEMVRDERSDPSVNNDPTPDSLPIRPRLPQNQAGTYQPTAVNPAMPRNIPAEEVRFEPEVSPPWPNSANYTQQPARPRQVPSDRPVGLDNRGNTRVATGQGKRPLVTPPPQKKSKIWLIPLVFVLLMLVVIGWLLFNLLSVKTSPTQDNLTDNPAPALTTAASTTTALTTAVATKAVVVTIVAATVPAVVPVSVKINASQLDGAYDRDDHTLFGRTEQALYGVGSTFNQATVTFNLDRVPTGKPVLRITGLDDELAAHCNFEVLLNGTSIFNGPNTFPNVQSNDTGLGGKDRYWGDMTIAVPASAFKAGPNTLVLRNTTPWSGQLGVPYILINVLSVTG